MPEKTLHYCSHLLTTKLFATARMNAAILPFSLFPTAIGK